MGAKIDPDGGPEMVGIRRAAAVRRVLATVLALLVGTSLLTLAAPPAGAGLPPAPPAPVPTLARANDATNIYSIGDSISTATGTGNLGAETPANSWVTGSNGAVNSMRARLGIAQGSAVTLATNGRRMQDFDDQANQLPSSAAYVVVELGGNDLCRPSVAEMTSVAAYRTQLRNGLAAVRANAPDALVFIASIPDIYNLWYLRGAEQPYNPNPSGRRGGLTGAHAFWDTYSVIPCQSLVDNPTDSSAGATARRLAVRQRTLDFNQVLLDECNLVLRCRYDGGQMFELSSNRVDPYANVEPGPNGYLPSNQRWFTDDDISHNTGFWSLLCPAPGVLEGGTVCGDHFHPSLQGQGKLAESGHTSSFHFPDNTFPDPTLAPQRGPDGGGDYASAVAVDVTATDDVAVRGFEYRVHHPNGTIDAWTTHIGTSFSVPVAEQGTTHVEARAMDVNGNLSASEWTTVTIDADAFVTFSGDVVEEGSGTPLEGVTVDLHDDTTEGVLATTTTDASGAFSFPDVHEDEAIKLDVVDDDGSHIGEWAQNADSHATADVLTAAADGPVTVRLTRTPTIGLDVEKVATADVVAAGSPISWQITVANPGETTLTGIDVQDDLSQTCEQSVPDLAQDDSHVITCEQPTTAADAGELTNTVVVDAEQLDEPVEAAATTRVCVAQFDDVSGAHPFFLDVCWLVGEGITTGYEDGTYRPSSPVSRQAMAAFLHRLAGAPTVSLPTTPTFTDVSSTHPFYDEVEWAAGEGIITGFADETFKPSTAVSRQAMAAFMYRMVDPPGWVAPPASSFTDVGTGHPFFSQIAWLASEGISTGYDDDTFRPSTAVSRQSMAAFLHRLAPLLDT
jgi:lysophospholipase L1-like esterase